jgi:hypothetical protein
MRRRTRVALFLSGYRSATTHPNALRAVFCAMFVVVLASLAPTGAARAEQTPSPPGAEEYIIWPSDGAVIHGGKLWVRMGLRNMGVCPKGFNRPNTGHHHLIVDADLPPLDQEIPSDRNHLHYGAGETDAHLELTPGKHTLQLLLGDANHRPHDPPVYSKKITIVVR